MIEYKQRRLCKPCSYRTGWKVSPGERNCTCKDKRKK